MPFVFDPTVKYTPQPQPKNGDFVRGLKQAGHELVGTGYGLAGLAGAGLGVDPLKEWGLENAQEAFDKSAALGSPTDSIEGINSVGDAADYLQRGLGYVGAQAIPALLTGGVGTALGKKAVSEAVRELAAKQVATSATEAAAIKAAREQVAKAATRGGIAGAALSSYGQEAGSMYPEMVREGYDEPGRAALYALPAAALDVLPEARIIKGLARPGVNAAERGFWRNVGVEGLKQAGMEGATEVGQTAI